MGLPKASTTAQFRSVRAIPIGRRYNLCGNATYGFYIPHSAFRILHSAFCIQPRPCSRVSTPASSGTSKRRANMSHLHMKM